MKANARKEKRQSAGVEERVGDGVREVSESMNKEEVPVLALSGVCDLLNHTVLLACEKSLFLARLNRGEPQGATNLPRVTRQGLSRG